LFLVSFPFMASKSLLIVLTHSTLVFVNACRTINRFWLIFFISAIVSIYIVMFFIIRTNIAIILTIIYTRFFKYLFLSLPLVWHHWLLPILVLHIADVTYATSKLTYSNSTKKLRFNSW